MTLDYVLVASVFLVASVAVVASVVAVVPVVAVASVVAVVPVVSSFLTETVVAWGEEPLHELLQGLFSTRVDIFNYY
jgi:hypothetical protein